MSYQNDNRGRTDQAYVLEQNTPKTQASPLGATNDANFLHKLLSNMAMYTKHPLPYPGQQGVPFFDGKDATQFIEDIEFMFVNHRVSRSKWIKTVPNYCRPLTRSKAKNFAAYKDGLWDDYKKEFLNW